MSEYNYISPDPPVGTYIETYDESFDNYYDRIPTSIYKINDYIECSFKGDKDEFPECEECKGRLVLEDIHNYIKYIPRCGRYVSGIRAEIHIPPKQKPCDRDFNIMDIL